MAELLTDKKKEWLAVRSDSKAVGNPLNYNAAIQSQYVDELVALSKQMTSQTKRELIRFFRSPVSKEFFAMDESVASQAKILTNAIEQKFTRLFNKRAKKYAESMVNQSDKASATGVTESLKQLSGGLTIPTSSVSAGMGEILTASVAENVSLIKSIADRYLGQVQSAVLRSVTTGNGLQDLVPFLEKQEGITVRHARNVALDQTRKTYNALNKARMERAGIKKFKWLHTGGSQKPRRLHMSYSGQIFSFDNLPVIDDDGTRGIPGQAINCGCRMVPVLEYEEESEDDASEEG